MSYPLGFSSLFRRAFSILELVAVLVIIGILSGLGAYGYSNFIAVAEQKTERARVESSVRASTAGVVADLPGGRMAMFDSDATSTVLPAFASIMGTHGFTVVWDTTPDDGVVGVASDDFDWDLGLVDGRVVVAAGEEQAMSSTLSFVTPSATYGAYFMNMGTFYDVAWGHTNDVSTYPAGSYIEISYQVVADSGVLVSNSGASTHTVTFTGLSSGVSALGSTSIPFSTQLAMAAGASSLVDTSGAAAIDVAAATQTSDWLVLAGTATLYDATDAVLATDPNFYEVVTLDSAGSGSQFQGIAHGPTVGIYSDWASRAGNVTLYTSWLPNTSAGFKQLYEVELTDGFEGPVVFSEVIDIEALGFDGTSRSLAIDTGVAAATAVSNNWDLYSQGRHCIVPVASTETSCAAAVTTDITLLPSETPGLMLGGDGTVGGGEGGGGEGEVGGGDGGEGGGGPDGGGPGDGDPPPPPPGEGDGGGGGGPDGGDPPPPPPPPPPPG